MPLGLFLFYVLTSDDRLMHSLMTRRPICCFQVSVRYIGKLKKNGEIFDSNIGRAPFKFRLGTILFSLKMARDSFFLSCVELFFRILVMQVWGRL